MPLADEPSRIASSFRDSSESGICRREGSLIKGSPNPSFAVRAVVVVTRHEGVAAWGTQGGRGMRITKPKAIISESVNAGSLCVWSVTVVDRPVVPADISQAKVICYDDDNIRLGLLSMG